MAVPSTVFAQDDGSSAAASGETETAAEGSEAAAAETPAAEATKTSSASESAKLYAEAGATYYRAGQYLEAAEQFQKAYEITPTPALAYNIGRSYERLSQWEESITWYERYAKAAKDPRDRAETLEKIGLLRKKLGPDSSSPDAQYKARLEAGRKAYSAGDYEAAIEEFKAAFDIKSSPNPLYNIGKAYEKMGRYEESIDAFTQYLELDPNASDKADVEELIRRLKASIKSRFSELSVASDPPGADIYLDDRNTGLQGQTNYRFKVPPGPHTLFLDLNGYEPVKRDFVMPDDKPLALDFKMKKLENVGFITIEVSQPGARIFIDGAIVGLSPYAQKKTLQQGKHQMTVELLGFDRWTQAFEVKRDETKVIRADLNKYDAPVKDSTLSSWGRNLMLTGIIGGTLGFFGPLVYQKFIRSRPYYTQLGDASAGGAMFYRGPLADDAATKRTDGEFKALKLTQMISLIAGSTLTAGGLAFYFYKWFRTVPPAPVTSSVEPAEGPRFEAWSIVPTPDGAAVGVTGRF